MAKVVLPGDAEIFSKRVEIRKQFTPYIVLDPIAPQASIGSTFDSGKLRISKFGGTSAERFINITSDEGGGIEIRDRVKPTESTSLKEVPLVRLSAAEGGFLTIHDENGNVQTIMRQNGISFFNKAGETETAALYVDSKTRNGFLSLRNQNGITALLNGSTGDLTLGAWGTDGTIKLRSFGGAETAALYVDSKTRAGTMELSNSSGDKTLILDGAAGFAALKDIALFPPTKSNEDLNNATIRARGETGNLALLKGSLSITNGGITIKSGNINMGSGDIILQGADCAEEFDIIDSETVEPGSVLVLDEIDERLCISHKEYDKKVIGVASGAKTYKPGLILDKKATGNKRIAIALMGKVFCKVDADYASIERGDVLTTSNTPGHAMKAEDPYRSFGALIGKALISIKSGKGLIPILASLQ